MKKVLFLSLLMFASCSGNTEKYIEKHVTFPENATLQEKVDLASRLVPTEQQLEWQKMEFTAFLHFGVNTFTGREWGDGKEDPNVFNPTELDCEQWVKALKDAGFKMALITAKHHDGFCLWPTKTTRHSVAYSKWKNGKGDVVAELRKACKKYGMKFGVYLSPWDRNAECYGDSPAYNKFFVDQLTELLTNYGKVHEVWFDGACGEGPNGKKQVYDWDLILKTIHTLQPDAVTAIMGDDVRWVGNEGGMGRSTEWSATVRVPGAYSYSEAECKRLGISDKSKDLGSRALLANARELFWYPSEVDVSIRPGWFYHANQDEKVRSLANLVDIYYKSVGCNAVLLLNIPPDRRGLIHPNDVKRIKELSDYLATSFSKSLMSGGDEYWTAQAGDSKEFEVESGAFSNTFMIQEDISKGQHIEEFIVETYSHGEWNYLTGGTTVGYKRLLRFSDVLAEKIRVRILESRGAANVCKMGLYYAKPLEDRNSIAKLSDVDVSNWKVVNPESDAVNAVDGKQDTKWTIDGLAALTVDMGEIQSVRGFSYAPVLGENLDGTIFHYKFYVSENGKDWTLCDAPGEFSNIMHNPVPYFVSFGKTYQARFFRLESVDEINGKDMTSIGDVGIMTK